MPGAGDPQNVVANLKTLASLASRTEGAKLSYDTQSGRFSVQGVGLKQSVVRTFTKESVLDETRFRRPILELFQAVANPLPGEDNEELIFAARDGLVRLASTYSGDPQKKAVVDRVIAEIKRWIQQETVTSWALRMKHQAYLIYAISQGITTVGDRGVCFGFVCDWARRIKVSGKLTYAHTKAEPYYSAEVSFQPSPFPGGDQRGRMQRKNDKRIEPLHRGLAKAARPKGMDQVTYFNLLVNTGSKYYSPRFEIFRGMQIVQYNHGNQDILVGERGRELFQTIELAARQHFLQTRVFMVGFADNDQSGHAIGIELSDGLHVFDPNVGEFWFRSTAPEKDRWEFVDDWWQFCGATQNFTRWELKGFLHHGIDTLGW
jgi:hypothetical protein